MAAVLRVVLSKVSEVLRVVLSKVLAGPRVVLSKALVGLRVGPMVDPKVDMAAPSSRAGLEVLGGTRLTGCAIMQNMARSRGCKVVTI